MKETIKLNIILILCAASCGLVFAIFCPALAQTGGTLYLSWNANSEPDLAGYNVYRSITSGGGYPKLNTSLIADTTYQDNGLTYGITYYYVVTAVDTASNESGYSNEASGTLWTQSTISLAEGYNLISFNVSVTNDSIRAVLESLPEGSYTYVGDYVDGHWCTWASGRPDFANDLKTLSPLRGHWIKMASVQTLEIKGTPIAPDTAISLDEGSNLISYLPSQPDSLSHAIAALPFGSYTYLAGFTNGQWQTWASGRPDFVNDLKVLYPGQGYWITMASPQVLRYPVDGYTGGDGAGKLVALTGESVAHNDACRTSAPNFTIVPTPLICDFWSENTTLDNENVRIGDVITAKDPDGVICGVSVVEDERGYLLHVYGDDPTTADVDEGAREGDRISFYINGYEAEQKATWTERGSVEIVLTATSKETPVLPKMYALFQSFPNPFNPETRIRYQLPQDSQIEIIIYSLTGQKVRTLVSGAQKAGRHLVTWDGKDDRRMMVGSGVYFYRMRTAEFTDVKRMLLLR